MQESWNNQFEEKPVRLSDYLRVLYRGRWIIILSFIIVLAATAYYTFTTPPTYEAECSVIVDQEGSIETTLFGSTPFSKQVTEINNQVEILKSRRLAETVVDNLLNSPVRDSLKLFYVENPEEPVNYRKLGIARVRSNMDISPVRDTDIIRIKMKAPSSWEAAFLANKVAENHRRLDRTSSQGEISEVVSFLEEQISQKEKELKASEEKLRKYQQSTGIIGLSEETQTMVDQLVEFESKYQEARTELKSTQKRLDYLKSQLGEHQASMKNELSQISTPLIQELRQKIAQKEAEKIKLKMSKNMGENRKSYLDVDIKKIRREIAEYKEELNKEIEKVLVNKVTLPLNEPLKPYQEVLDKIISAETTVQAYTAKADALKKIVDEHNKRLETLPSKSLKLARLERARKLNENLYLMMKEKYDESRITKAGQIGKIRLVDRAVPPESPISPKKKLNLLLGILIGLGLGVGITFFMEYMDNSVRTLEDVENLKLPVLGSIPEIKPEEANGLWRSNPLRERTSRKRKSKSKSKEPSGSQEIANRLITHVRPKSPISEAYRSLRTQIQYAKRDTSVHSILVSSPGPGEGKSTSVTNLAIAMAQMGSKTLLVDADLRRPVLHSLFSVKRENGLSNYLVGKASLDEIIKPTKIENLNLITTGILPPNPSEILSSKRMQQMIEALGEQFDYILLDSPPIIAVTDALVVAPWVDGMIMVLRSGTTDQDAAVRAQDLIQNVGAKLLGSLLNDVSSSYMYGSYYYYYYYYYYYGGDDGKKKKKRGKHRKKHRPSKESLHA